MTVRYLGDTCQRRDSSLPALADDSFGVRWLDAALDRRHLTHANHELQSKTDSSGGADAGMHSAGGGMYDAGASMYGALAPTSLTLHKLHRHAVHAVT